MKITIDNQEFELDEPMTILLAAKKMGIEIPTMCYFDGYDPFTSCMICMIKETGSGAKLPACSAQAFDGMVVETQSDEIKKFRKSTLELLLSDHVGDCEAPCRRGCAVDLEIPRMIRETGANQMVEAVATVRRDVAIPSLLERVCHAPCETPCRRVLHDDALQIRHLALYASDWDLQQETQQLPEMKPASGKRVVIVGGGTTGLSAAHYLTVKGHACTILERAERAGGRLHTDFDERLIPDWAFEGEIKVLEAMGIQFEYSRSVDDQAALQALNEEYDAVLLACGEKNAEELEALGLEQGKKGIKYNAKTNQTANPAIFAAGNIVKPDKRLLKSAASAKDTSVLIDCYLEGTKIRLPDDVYDHRMGKLQDGEIDIFVDGANAIPRLEPTELDLKGFTREEAEVEATRCMHCDCREKDNCKLRDYSDDYEASQKHFKGEERAHHMHLNQDAGAVYEAGKCIKCGLCVHVTQKHGEDFGFSFLGRGYDLKTTVSLGKTLKEGLDKVAAEVVYACPTGALSANEKLGKPSFKIQAPAATAEDSQPPQSA